MILELAQLSDLDAINALVKQADELHAAWRPDQFGNTDCGFSEQCFLELQKDKEIYVVRNQGAAVAFVRIRIQPIGRPDDVPVKKVMYLEEICVDKTLRNQGIGKHIMDDLKAMARQEGCRSICLTVYPENEDARAFYEKSGFAVNSINMRAKI